MLQVNELSPGDRFTIVFPDTYCLEDLAGEIFQLEGFDFTTGDPIIWCLSDYVDYWIPRDATVELVADVEEEDVRPGDFQPGSGA